MKLHLSIAAVVLLFASGFTSCQYFHDTVVPVTDTVAPTAFNGINRAGQYEVLRIDGPVDYQLSSPSDSVLAVAAATDDGGTRRVTMYISSVQVCCKGGICSRTQTSSVPSTQTQDGAIGDTVSNGVWNYAGAGPFACPSGYSLRSYDLGWTSEVEDFHGNVTTVTGNHVHYP